MKQKKMFFGNSLSFSTIQQMLAICSLVPLPFLKPYHAAYRISVHPPGIKPVHLAVEAQNPNQWTASEVLREFILEQYFWNFSHYRNNGLQIFGHPLAQLSWHRKLTITSISLPLKRKPFIAKSSSNEFWITAIPWCKYSPKLVIFSFNFNIFEKC